MMLNPIVIGDRLLEDVHAHDLIVAGHDVCHYANSGTAAYFLAYQLKREAEQQPPRTLSIEEHYRAEHTGKYPFQIWLHARDWYHIRTQMSDRAIAIINGSIPFFLLDVEKWSDRPRTPKLIYRVDADAAATHEILTTFDQLDHRQVSIVA